MKVKQFRERIALCGFLLLFLLPALACGFNVSTANIKSVVLARDNNGRDQTTTFSPNDVFYAIVELANAPSDTTVSAVWTAVSVEGVDPNLFIDEVEYTTGSGTVTFNLSNDGPWPAGQYKVDLYLNGEFDRSLSFQVR